MVSRDLLPLTILNENDGREVRGITRFQKLVFLAQNDYDLDDLFEFQSDKYGPFSKELYASLDSLEERGLVERDEERTRGGNELYIYQLTGLGKRALERQTEKDPTGMDHISKISKKTKQKHNSEPLERLLRYVYENYPDYTDKSELDIS